VNSQATPGLRDEGETPMGVYDDEDEFEQGGEQGGKPQTNAEFAALRKANQAAKRAEQERDQAKREAAFLRAGIDPDDTRLSYFVKGYEGDLKADVIKQAAIDAGFIQAAAPSPEQQQAAEQQQQALGAQQRVAGVAQAGPGATPDVGVQQRQALEDAYKAGGIEAMTAAMQAMGVPRVTN
jgi:ribosomal protein L12E/L44/L45/RPP1/RPP2